MATSGDQSDAVEIGEVARLRAMAVELARKLEHVKEMQQELEAEKQRIAQCAVAPLDTIVDVNVGGTVFTTLRSTMCSLPGTFLEAIFSGRHRTLTRDGAVFIDRNAQYFQLILDWLRSPTPARLASLPMHDALFVEELEYYGLLSAIQSRQGQSVVLLVGGQNERNIHVCSAVCYDFEQEKWIACASMGQARAYAAACVLAGQLYVVGGQDAGHCNTVERYSPDHNAWAPVAPMRVARSGLACAATNTVLYAAGGMAAGRRLALVEAYSPVLNTWTSLPSLPVPLSLLGLCAFGEALFAFGGEEMDGVPSKRVYKYTAAAAAAGWSEAAPMLRARDTFGWCVLDGMLYVCGGWGGAAALAAVERYSPERDEWTAVAPMPGPRVACCAVAVAGKLVVVGGIDARACVAEAFQYDPLADAWARLPSLPAARYAAAVGVVRRGAWVSTSAAPASSPPASRAGEAD
jgi:N-acetylneuraminic acid mutarotase